MERVQTHLQVNQVPRQANPFEAGIEGPLGNGFIRQRIQNFIRDAFSLCQIDHLHFAAVHGIAEDKNLKGWRLCIFVYAALGQIDITVAFNIDTDSFHTLHLEKTARHKAPPPPFTNTYFRKDSICLR